MIESNTRTARPRGVREPGVPIGAQLATPRIMLVGSSYVVGGIGFGDTTGNSYQYNLHLYVASCGIVPTWIGNLTRGTAPADHHRGVVGATIPDHMVGGTFDSVQFVATLGPVDIVMIDLQINDMGVIALADPDTFQANYIMLASQFFAAGVPRCIITMMNVAGDADRRARFPPCWERYPAIEAGIEATGMLCTVADVRSFDNEANLYSAETSGSRLHPGDSGYAILAERFAPSVMNAAGFNAAWWGDAAT